MVFCLFIAGCVEERLPSGVVAAVNDEYITLREVEALHDVSGMGVDLLTLPVEAESPFPGVRSTDKGKAASVEQLRSKYGEALSSLVVQKLVAQHLQKEEIPITDEEAAAAELAVRADYPEGEFEKVLQEEYIDLELWRSFLRLRLGIVRLQERVLRPLVSISAKEVSEWYSTHEDDFRLPARVNAVVYAGVSKEQMDGVRKTLAAGGEPALSENLTRQELNLAPERLVPQWVQDLKEAGRGKPGPVRELDGLFQVIVLVGETPARKLTVVQAYPRIESLLVEEKLGAVFEEWLRVALGKAHVRVAASLLPQKAGETAPAEMAKEIR